MPRLTTALTAPEMRMADPETATTRPAAVDGDRLESWKDIASYLKRDVRTVQRWERREGLPIHRHPSAKLGGVYAFKTELDAWWGSPRGQAAGAAPSSPTPAPPEVGEARVRHSSPARRIGAIASVTLAVGLIGWLVGRAARSGDSGAGVASAVARLWSGPELTVARSISTDGSRLYFFDPVTGVPSWIDWRTKKRGALPTARARGAATGGFGSTLAASPDGTLIAFEVPAGGHSSIRLMRVDDGSWRTLDVPDSFTDAVPVEWSRDGRNLLVRLTARDAFMHVALISVQTGSIAFAKRLSIPTAFVALSPDATQVACSFGSRSRGVASEGITLISATDGTERVVVNDTGLNLAPKWSSDGSQILFLSDRTGAPALWSQRIVNGKAAGTPVLVKLDMQHAVPLRVENDGSYDYAVIHMHSEDFIVDLDPATGRAIHDPAQVAAGASGGSAHGIAWSPDGRELAVARGKAWDVNSLFVGPQFADLWITGAAMAPRKVVTSFTMMHHPVWSPDGQRILVYASGPGRPVGLYTLVLQTDEATLLVPGNPVLQYGWIGDGSRIYYRRPRQAVVSRSLVTGEEQVLSPECEDAAVSDDGRQVAYLLRDPSTKASVLMVSGANRAAREVARVDPPQAFVSVGWNPDGERVFVAKNLGRYDGELCVVPVKGGAPVQLGVHTGWVSDLRVRSDGRQLSYHDLAYRGEVWRVSNLSAR